MDERLFDDFKPEDRNYFMSKDADFEAKLKRLHLDDDQDTVNLEDDDEVMDFAAKGALMENVTEDAGVKKRVDYFFWYCKPSTKIFVLRLDLRAEQSFIRSIDSEMTTLISSKFVKSIVDFKIRNRVKEADDQGCTFRANIFLKFLINERSNT